ncbi:hypothetical protein EK0264_01600 [Epidermidibacterium keratini]|uniref:Uncharacterized protein n=1 Tax=Epidermidibacterium keratini TaxID=1891644 RepID=A0A7L4YHY2_9ACTN|nr:hypothetical protein [Epidermidibacterium keratini]QHB99110.1 hypothetical protein EK0264_01600 [Epidermidibacterium keratini]
MDFTDLSLLMQSSSPRKQRRPQPVAPPPSPPSASWDSRPVSRQQMPSRFGFPVPNYERPHEHDLRYAPPPTLPIATASACGGIVVGAVSALFALATFYMPVTLGAGGQITPRGWLFALLCLGAAISAISGSIRLLSGTGGVAALRIGCAAALAAIWLQSISGVLHAEDQADAAAVYGALGILASIVPVATVLCSLSREIGEWLAKRAAWRAAGGL